MERDEIEKKVRNETRKIEGIRNRKMLISSDEWNALFGESDSEEEFEGFRAEDIEKCLRLLGRRYMWEKRRTSSRSEWRKHGWNAF